MSALKRWALRVLAVVALASILPACKSNGSGQNVVNVTAIFSEGGQYPFPRSTIIYVDFDQLLNPATVTASNFQVFLVGGVGAWPVVQAPTYNPVLSEVAIYPAVLASGTPGTQTYVVNVSTTVLDTNGDPCSGAQMAFEVVATGDTDAPVFGGGTGIAAAQGAAGEINISWNAATDATGPVSYYLYGSTVLGGEGFGNPVAGPITAPTQMATVSGLNTGTVYFFVVRARDAAGNEDQNTTQSAGVAAP